MAASYEFNDRYLTFTEADMHAQQITHGVRIAVKRPGVAIPEVALAEGKLDDYTDFHFGICSDAFDGILSLSSGGWQNVSDRTQKRLFRLDEDLKGLGPRILDIKTRGGRTAEDSLHEELHGRGTRARGGKLMEMRGQIATDATKSIKPGKDVFPLGARRFDGGTQQVESVAGQGKYIQGATHKDQTMDYVQMATRWSKAALEVGLSTPGKHIHFHLDGLGDISDIIGKAGDFSYNVTARELRYIYRNWIRFQRGVIFYNGYTGDGKAVIVEPPWLPDWQSDDAVQSCPRCAKVFSFIERRHHCRGCGLVFCDACCTGRKRLEWPVCESGKRRETEPVRLCADCYGRF